MVPRLWDREVCLVIGLLGDTLPPHRILRRISSCSWYSDSDDVSAPQWTFCWERIIHLPTWKQLPLKWQSQFNLFRRFLGPTVYRNTNWITISLNRIQIPNEPSTKRVGFEFMHLPYSSRGRVASSWSLLIMACRIETREMEGHIFIIFCLDGLPAAR